MMMYNLVGAVVVAMIKLLYSCRTDMLIAFCMFVILVYSIYIYLSHTI